MSNKMDIRITIIDLKTGDVEQTHVTDVSRSTGRDFMRRTQSWAWNNHKGIATALDSDVAGN